ncbi:MAG: TonB-dependent receptor [Acidobacteria bacterium]|nr:TonB-dependent receptor [Acidobacteriota bacterium]
MGDRADEQARSTGRAPERLRPEVTNNFDMGVRLRRGRWEAEASTFWLNLSNSIVSQTLLLPAGAVGQGLGEQTIARQLESGAVFVPISTAPVLVRGNFSGARMRGWEQRLRVQLTKAWSLSENLTSITARDAITGQPPDIEPGVPPLTVNPVVTWRPAGGRFWAEGYATLADRQERLSSLALSDRRIGNPRSRANIQSFFQNGARVRGLVRDGILLPTGETLGQVQNRVLGGASSAPQFTAIAGYAVVGLRGGMSVGENTEVSFDLTNLGDKNYRGIGWGVDGPGRAWMVQVRRRF